MTETFTKNTLNDKFKALEKEFRTEIPANSIVGMRLDGKSFGTFTKQFIAPYDFTFMNAMDDSAMFLLKKLINGAMFAYVQSDEITVFFGDSGNTNTQMVFGGKVEKILSTSASATSIGFMRALPEALGDPIFDARLFVLKDLDEVQEYMDWRRMDARKNAISMAAEQLASSKQLMNLSTKERLALLSGTEFEKLPFDFLFGRIIFKETYEDTVTFLHSKKKETVTEDVTRTRWTKAPAFRDTTETLVDSFRK